MTTLSLNDRINLCLLTNNIITEDDESDKDENDKDSTRFIHTNQVDRSAMLQAMSAAGHTVTSLSAECGVEPSMISRLLREPKSGDPDESARNPSMTLAAQISAELNISPESLFSDIFDLNKPGSSARKNKSRDRKTRKHVQSRSSAEYQDGT